MRGPGQVFCSALLALALGACGGGGSSSSSPAPPPPAPNPPPPQDPFGLTMRAALASFDLPSQAVSGGSFTLVNAFPNLSFTQPVFVSGIPGETRLAVVEKPGRIVAFDDAPGTGSFRTVLNLTARIEDDGEQGLLGLAFDPDFALNRYIYLHFSELGPRRSTIARFTWDSGSDSVDTASEKTILEVDQPFSNHNAGMLAFGPDGYLYIAMGDGGSGGDPLNHGQDRSTLLGNMLRVDVHPQNASDPYDVPLDNPFTGQPNVRPEIYAWGLRNPWRFSFDRQTGDLLAGDVGQNAIEEIDHIVSGGNYGWRVFEGTQDFDDSLNTLPPSAFTPPVYEYDHGQGSSVTGGYVYRGTELAGLFGRYVYADFVSGTVWAFDWNGATASNNEILTSVSNPASFGEKNDGELLLASLSGSLFEFQDDSGSGEIPTLLSETGLFTNLATLTPASGLIEYDVRHPFFSDGASKRRWVGIPDASQIEFAADDLVFPLGTVVVKHFEMNLTEGDPATARRLETRVLVNTTDGWLGFTYRWNGGETDADLLSGRETEDLVISTGSGSRVQTYEYPSRTDCLACHTAAAGATLGLKTPQLNADFDYSGTVDNQLRSWNNIDLFDRDIGDASQFDQFVELGDATADLDTRARTYLDVNCSHCHRPNGPTGTDLDLRLETADMNAIDEPPLAGDLGVANAMIIASGDRDRSVLWLRMQNLDSERMPPLSHNLVDQAAADVIGDWIDAL